MTEPLPDTWHNRDLPVLRAVVRLYDETLRVVPASAVVSATGLTDADVQRAGVALAIAGFFETKGRGGARKVEQFGTITERARREAGAWPTPETAADRLIAALEQIAENTNDEDTRTRAEKALDALTGAGRSIAVGVGTAVISGAVQ